MSRLILVRHGQASFVVDRGAHTLSADYDRLSAIGERQAAALGKYWERTGMRFDWAIRGPAKRHARTEELVLAGLREGGKEVGESLEMKEFDEYPAFEVMRTVLPELIERDEGIAAMEAEYRRLSEPAEAARGFERLFQRVMRMWARGEVEAAGVEAWAEFCGRVKGGLERVRREAGQNSRIVVFTSGGPVAVAMREALGLSGEKTMELSWASRNGSFSEFLFSGTRFSLGGFNHGPHLEEGWLETYR